MKNTLKGIKRTLGTAALQKTPVLTDDIRAMVGMADCGLIGLRDRALILLGFAGAFRRSEITGLDVADCGFGKDGLTIILRRSKTDQDGQGRKIGIPSAPILRRVRFGFYKRGWNRPHHPAARYSFRSIGMAKYRLAGFLLAMLPGS